MGGQQVKMTHPAKKPMSELEFECLVVQVLKEMNLEDELTTTPTSSLPGVEAGSHHETAWCLGWDPKPQDIDGYAQGGWRAKDSDQSHPENTCTGVPNYHTTQQQQQKMLQIMFQNINCLLVSITHPKTKAYGTLSTSSTSVSLGWPK